MHCRGLNRRSWWINLVPIRITLWKLLRDWQIPQLVGICQSPVSFYSDRLFVSLHKPTCRLLGVSLSVLAALWVTSPLALAHATLTGSAPANGSRVEQPPPAIVLSYSEELDLAFSQVEVRNAAGQIIAAGSGTLDPAGSPTLRLALAPLPAAGYRVTWLVRSLVDGHLSVGAVNFAVGKDTPLPSLLPPPGTEPPTTAQPEAVEVGLRWLTYLAVAFTLGPVAFALFVWQHSYRRTLGDRQVDGVSRQALVATDVNVSRGLRRLVIGGSVGIAGLSLLFAFYQAWRLAPVTADGTVGQALLGLLAGPTLPLLLARFGVLLGIWLIASELTPTAQPLWAWWVTLWLGLGLGFSFSLQGHTAAFAARLPILLDLAHLAAMSAWLGGLVCLVFTLRWRRELAGPFWRLLVRRFSALALTSVGVLTLTGLYNAYDLVGDPSQLLATTYGRALAAKVGLLGLLALLGAFNFLVFSPRSTHATTSTSWLTRTAASEMLLAGLALLAAAMMTTLAPAADVLLAQKQLGVTARQRQQDLQSTVWIVPARVGENEFAVDVLDRRRGVDEQQNPLQVWLRLTYLNAARPVQELSLVLQGAGRYTLRGDYLPLAGQWRATVILRRAGFADVEQSVVFDTLDQVFP